jgi:murein DD-endopeptidase MepM/ murein hydrolase activator NlpD
MPARRRTRPRHRGTLRLGLLLCGLVAINVYVFFYRGGTNLRDVLKAQSLAPNTPGAQAAGGGEGDAPSPVKAPPAEKIPAPVMEDEDARRIEGTMGPKDTLAGVLGKQGVSAAQVDAIVHALAGLWDPRTIREGQTYMVGFDAEGALRSFEYHASPIVTYRVQRNEKGELHGRREDKPLETKTAGVGGTIEDSLWQAVVRSGESTNLVGFFVDVFSYDINFFIDTQSGDKFRILVEKKYLGGKFYGYGKVLAAEYTGHTGTFRAFYYDGNYYDENGQSIVRSLLKTPLKFVRVSSKFDRHRFHPILHTERAHLGIDYAAPQGTPVWASATGRVEFAGPHAGSGNTIVVDHANGMQTRYYHLSRFAKGLRIGQTVRQKQVIGYVGMTGLATGPHLHFSITMHGSFVDPSKFKAAREAPLSGAKLAAFRAEISPRIAELAKVATPALAASP